ncbi:hypothetical protein VOLCADRAFT_91103 [Volvox carteri f. nagariensis]|uniref:Uncharacterized protein n=1 Tax=Volvox carteri f. nagariensis TaxID=3068 RepID=D8TW67_VOLCA|nr:uncharacterized protein VOLCADRAFT_91103 [Volvox carteri f. nagariensis]EFJ48319.1 hypothetical protein VOLCADRAFT_91103 [Volvox carteri f. nagariensis]|eukprot:XP_002950573.1 hypothetical protein VOLCADRAFT_91103 [Volvox carteri f. nagariensis]
MYGITDASTAGNTVQICPWLGNTAAQKTANRKPQDKIKQKTPPGQGLYIGNSTTHSKTEAREDLPTPDTAPQKTLLAKDTHAASKSRDTRRTTGLRRHTTKAETRLHKEDKHKASTHTLVVLEGQLFNYHKQRTPPAGGHHYLTDASEILSANGIRLRSRLHRRWPVILHVLSYSRLMRRDPRTTALPMRFLPVPYTGRSTSAAAVTAADLLSSRWGTRGHHTSGSSTDRYRHLLAGEDARTAMHATTIMVCSFSLSAEDGATWSAVHQPEDWRHHGLVSPERIPSDGSEPTKLHPDTDGRSSSTCTTTTTTTTTSTSSWKQVPAHVMKRVIRAARSGYLLRNLLATKLSRGQSGISKCTSAAQTTVDLLDLSDLEGELTVGGDDPVAIIRAASTTKGRRQDLPQLYEPAETDIGAARKCETARVGAAKATKVAVGKKGKMPPPATMLLSSPKSTGQFPSLATIHEEQRSRPRNEGAKTGSGWLSWSRKCDMSWLYAPCSGGCGSGGGTGSYSDIRNSTSKVNSPVGVQGLSLAADCKPPINPSTTTTTAAAAAATCSGVMFNTSSAALEFSVRSAAHSFSTMPLSFDHQAGVSRITKPSGPEVRPIGVVCGCYSGLQTPEE